MPPRPTTGRGKAAAKKPGKATKAAPRKAAPRNGTHKDGEPSGRATTVFLPADLRDVPGLTEAEIRPCLELFQVLREDGTVGAPDALPDLAKDKLLALYRGMLLIRVMDERLMGLQRQGRIGFYGEAKGQEATVVGAALALEERDWVVPALREAGAAILRGLPLRTYVAQILGNASDPSKGRQMPCHPGSRASHYVTMSSCVATQIPHATGMAWAAKIRKDPVVVLGFMGDGATSEEDFHVGVNFAGVYKVPVVFICQNNQWAISTPVGGQTAAQTIALKGLAYGIPSQRIDGNDVLAVYAAVKRAVDRARAGGGPTFIEALTYRVSAHSSSDDPSRYRDETITEAWKGRDPLVRMRAYLGSRGFWSDAEDAALTAALDAEVKAAVEAEEKVGPPPIDSLVEDVYEAVPRHLRDQLEEFKAARARG